MRESLNKLFKSSTIRMRGTWLSADYATTVGAACARYSSRFQESIQAKLLSSRVRFAKSRFRSSRIHLFQCEGWLCATSQPKAQREDLERDIELKRALNGGIEGRDFG
jgi:hypothetical protein